MNNDKQENKSNIVLKDHKVKFYNASEDGVGLVPLCPHSFPLASITSCCDQLVAFIYVVISILGHGNFLVRGTALSLTLAA